MATIGQRLLLRLKDAQRTAIALRGVAQNIPGLKPKDGPPSIAKIGAVVKTPFRMQKLGFSGEVAHHGEESLGNVARENLSREGNKGTAEEVRKIMRKVPQPVAVVTTSNPHNPSERRGITVSSFTSIALHPRPLVAFSIRLPSRASEVLHAANRFVLHVLSSEQIQHSITFSSPSSTDPFVNIPHHLTDHGIPVLMGAVGAMVCKAEGVLQVGDHELWIGEVEKVEHGVGGRMGVVEEAKPLLYYERTYRSIGEEVFMQAFEEQTLDPREWSHRAHVRMAWNYIRSRGKQVASPLIKEGIRKYNARNPHLSHPYHETITSFFIHIIDLAVQADKRRLGDEEVDNFFEFMRRHPNLADRKYIHQYFSQDVLRSERSRQEFVEPDLKPLPSSLNEGELDL
ncbi:uncharacterized protein VTP21DRAFT_10340 [Calcarisporiella thermophila]|uniref:uncharacterized protein n=1 Tax=Calcarisporiella thermophila TaxID=911321 RepID=UPI0037430560